MDSIAPREFTVADSITIIDNRSGEQVEIPILDGGVDAKAWAKFLPGVWFHDPGFSTTSAASSAITELDGEKGILRYRGYSCTKFEDTRVIYREGSAVTLRSTTTRGMPAACTSCSTSSQPVSTTGASTIASTP